MPEENSTGDAGEGNAGICGYNKKGATMGALFGFYCLLADASDSA
jgi:hypothetical protein